MQDRRLCLREAFKHSVTESVFLAHWFPQPFQEVASWGINLEGTLLSEIVAGGWTRGGILEGPSPAPSCSDADGRSGVREVLR